MYSISVATGDLKLTTLFTGSPTGPEHLGSAQVPARMVSLPLSVTIHCYYSILCSSDHCQHTLCFKLLSHWGRQAFNPC